MLIALRLKFACYVSFRNHIKEAKMRLNICDEGAKETMSFFFPQKGHNKTGSMTAFQFNFEISQKKGNKSDI